MTRSQKKKALEEKGFKIIKVQSVVGSILGKKDEIWACYAPSGKPIAANKLLEPCLDEAIKVIQENAKETLGDKA